MIALRHLQPQSRCRLQGRVASEWAGSVQLFYGDMRTVELPSKVEILVSELLGSFADNELSPECLDGAQRFLARESLSQQTDDSVLITAAADGISIPSSYTSYLAPLSSAKLYSEARRGDAQKGSETPYVVMFQAVNILSGSGGGRLSRCGPKIQECWEFEHPRRDVPLDDRGKYL